MDKLRLKRYQIQSLPTALRRQLAPRPGRMEPGLPSKTKLVRVRVDRACLWSACKSTSLAMVLILIGATMATVGYYAPELSSRRVSLGNVTVTTMDASAHWHLKNLTYVGPAFMGLGSVIIVAICVMTFEARDKAAKICPEDPPKLVKEDTYVNVIKTIVRKYSSIPKAIRLADKRYMLSVSLMTGNRPLTGRLLAEIGLDGLVSCLKSIWWFGLFLVWYGSKSKAKQKKTWFNCNSNVTIHSEVPFEEAKLLPPPTRTEKNRPYYHLLEKPFDALLSTRSSSEPCFPNSFVSDTSSQLPLEQITSSDPAGDVFRSSVWVCDQTDAPVSLFSTVPIKYYNYPTENPLPAPQTSFSSKEHHSQSDNLPQIALNPPETTTRRPSAGTETVVDVHPLPQSSSRFPGQPASPSFRTVVGPEKVYPYLSH